MLFRCLSNVIFSASLSLTLPPQGHHWRAGRFSVSLKQLETPNKPKQQLQVDGHFEAVEEYMVAKRSIEMYVTCKNLGMSCWMASMLGIFEYG